jgi:hypothetical protein
MFAPKARCINLLSHYIGPRTKSIEFQTISVIEINKHKIVKIKEIKIIDFFTSLHHKAPPLLYSMAHVKTSHHLGDEFDVSKDAYTTIDECIEQHQ